MFALSDPAKLQPYYDVIIIGAGAAGLFCASQAGARGKSVLVVDHANRVGKKILMSGGGRCNFTNLYVTPEEFQSQNPHFVKSALSQYTQWDFISLVEAHQIPYHEKDQGQLFCDRKASDIVQMLVLEAQKQAVEIRTHTAVDSVLKTDEGFELKTTLGTVSCQSCVIATGGLSIPTMGATGFGYDIAKQFGHKIIATRAGLVPFTWDGRRKEQNKSLSGVSCLVRMSTKSFSYLENILFTHRGISGPAALKLSSHWHYGDTLQIDFLPGIELAERLPEFRQSSPKKSLRKLFQQYLPNQVVDWLLNQLAEDMTDKRLADLSNQDISTLEQQFHHWTWVPADTEGYRTAEVTLGGVSTDEISSKTMESKRVPGLYFIGEVMDVTGQLGGFNFQWAWSSAYAAAQAV
jgi:predicted Rossmann fold flavoprotein